MSASEESKPEERRHKVSSLESPYLEDYRTAIRSKTIPWDGFARSELLTQQEAKQLIELEGHTIKKRKETALNPDHIDDYTNTLLNLLSRDLPLERNDVKKYILVLFADLLENDLFIDKLIELNNGNPDVILTPFVKYLDNNDEIIRLFSIYNLTSILIQPEIQPTDDSIVLKLFQSLNHLIESSNFNLKFLSIELIVDLLLIKPYRSIYWTKHDEFISNLFLNLNEYLNNNSSDSIQFQYKILLSIWLLSFNSKILKELSTIYQNESLILLKLVKISIKEKIIRLIISILNNFTSIPSDLKNSLNNIKFLILIGNIEPVLNNLQNRKWSDDELIEDLEKLSSKISDVYSNLTSFDEYLQELNSKNLRNSPTHSNDEFFIDNLSKFQDSNYKIFKQLIELLDFDGNDSSNYAFILNDIGKILKLDSKAIDVLNELHKKTKIMELLNHKNSEVRYAALKTTQLIVSQTFK